jgi:hypothetical protein
MYSIALTSDTRPRYATYNVVFRQGVLNYVVLTTETTVYHSVRYKHKDVWLYRYLNVRRIVVRFQEDVRDLTLLLNVQTGSEARPSPYSMARAGYFTGNKAVEA